MTDIEARYDEVLTIIQNIIADLTGNELEDVDPMSDLEENLGITEVDFKRIVKTINSDFDIYLNASELIEEVETVAQLAVLVKDESELG